MGDCKAKAGRRNFSPFLLCVVLLHSDKQVGLWGGVLSNGHLANGSPLLSGGFPLAKGRCSAVHQWNTSGNGQPVPSAATSSPSEV